MYSEDSVMCCLFPYKCNLFHRTPGVIICDIMWYLNMTFAACSLILMVWGILRNLHRYVEFQKKICKFINYSKRKAIENKNETCLIEVGTVCSENDLSAIVNRSNHSTPNQCNTSNKDHKRNDTNCYDDASCSSAELIIANISLGCKRTDQLKEDGSLKACAVRCRSLSKNFSCSKSMNSNGCKNDDNYDDEQECCNMDLHQTNNERYCILSHDLDVCPLIDGEIFPTVRANEFVQIIQKTRKNDRCPKNK